MGKILITILSLCAFSVYANCDETWKNADYTQNIKIFQTGVKTYFHSLPDEKSKIKKLYLIHGDKFTGFLDYKNFEFGYYTKKNGSIVMGWLEKVDLIENNNSESAKKMINESDFIFYSPLGNIALNASFEGFYKKWGGCAKNEQQETGLWSNYISKENKSYKYFDHYWKGFAIRSSNINYEQFGSDFDTYRITTITVTNKKYITSRGVYIGMTSNNVSNAYGPPSRKSKTIMEYNFKNYTLDFTLEGDIVNAISMDEKIQ